MEAVTSQSMLAFIHGLKRFTARRGFPKRFISDNGKTFKTAAKYLQNMFKDRDVRRFLSDHKITWQFNVEMAPWWGGAFERMVRSTKICLRKLIRRAHFSLEEFTTALAESEAVSNSRPLGYVSGEDIDKPITPSHFVVGRRILSLSDHLDHMCPLDDDDFAQDQDHVNSRVKQLNNVLNHFWKRWHVEYMSDLREVHASSARRSQGNQKSHITTGEVVVIKDEHLPRGQWKLGVVQESMVGKDGQVRAATIRLASRCGQHSILSRPVQLLYPLEIGFKSAADNPDELTHDPQNPETRTQQASLSLESTEPALEQGTPEKPTRVRRAAAR